MKPICIAHRAHQKKMPGSSGCFDIRKQFCVPVMERKYRAMDASAAKPRCILPRLGSQSASNRRHNKGPVTRRGLLLPDLHRFSFPSGIFPAVILSGAWDQLLFHFPFCITDFAVGAGCSGIFPAVQCDCPENVPLFISLGINSLLPFY